MRHLLESIFVAALLLSVGIACGDDTDSSGDTEIVDALLVLLADENAMHYAFGCVDFTGDALRDNILPSEIAAAADQKAAIWESESSVVILGGGDQRSVVVFDPNSAATNADDFQERTVDYEDGTLTCYFPQ